MTVDRSRLIDRLALPFYFLLSAILLYPLSARLGEVLPGPRVDTWQNLWNYWWLGHAFSSDSGQPFFTPDLFYPYGADLSFHTLSLLNTIWAVPLGDFFSPVLLLGLSLFLAFPIGAWSMYLLTRDCIESRSGALLAGFIYAFFPHHLDQIYSHLNLTSQHLLPFFLLFLLRLFRNPSWKNGLATGLFLALQAYGCLIYMMQAFLVIALLGLARLIRGGGNAPVRAWLPGLAGGIVLFVVLILPMVIPALRLSSERGEFRYKQVRPAFSASLETLASPSVFHPIVGERVRKLNRRYDNLPRGATAHLGLGLIVLALFGTASRLGTLRTFGIASILFVVLAMGPAFQIRIGQETGIPLPYALMEKIPILRFLRVPNRFLVMASLFLAPLAGAGLARFLAGGPKLRMGGLMLAALLFFEYLPTPIRTAPISGPAFCDLLKERATSGAVLDVPLFSGGQSTIYMFNQTHHGRPIVAGYVSIPPPTAGLIVQEDPSFRWLADTGLKSEIDSIPSGSPVEAMRRLGIGDVVLHKDFDPMSDRRTGPPGMDWPEKTEATSWYWRHTTVTGSVPHKRMREYRKMLQVWLGRPYYEDDRVALFAVPES